MKTDCRPPSSGHHYGPGGGRGGSAGGPSPPQGGPPGQGDPVLARGSGGQQRGSSASNRVGSAGTYFDIANTILGSAGDLDDLLLSAARDGDYNRMEQLLLQRTDIIVDVDCKDKRTGNTALIWAAKKGHNKIVQLLLRHGADPTLRNYEAQTAVEVATGGTKTMLLDSVSRATESSHRLLLQAAWQGNLEVIRRLLSNNKRLDIDCQNAEGLTPLMLVARDVQLFERLAVQLNQHYHPVEVALELMKARANVHACDNDGKSCLHYAAQSRATVAERLVQTFIGGGSEPAQLDKRQYAAIHWASQIGNTNVVVALLDGGSEVNSRGFAGLTPLHISAHNDHQRTAITLLQHGADVTLTDDRGLTPVDLAKTRKMKTTLKEAWTEATQHNPAPELAPVRAIQSRESGSKSSLREESPARRKGEVIFDGMPGANAFGTQRGNPHSRGAVARGTPLAVAEKSRRAEMQMLNELGLENGRYTPSFLQSRENTRLLGTSRHKAAGPPILPHISKTTPSPCSPAPACQSPESPPPARRSSQGEELRRSLEDGRNMLLQRNNAKRAAPLPPSRRRLSKTTPLSTTDLSDQGGDTTHQANSRRSHRRTGSDPFSTNITEIASTLENIIRSRGGRSMSTADASCAPQHVSPLRTPLERDSISIPTTIPEATSPSSSVNTISFEAAHGRSGARHSSVMTLPPTGSHILPPTPTFLTQQSYSNLDSALAKAALREDDSGSSKDPSPRSDDELVGAELNKFRVGVSNPMELLRSRSLLKEEFILADSRPRDPMMVSSGSDHTSSSSNLSSSPSTPSPRDGLTRAGYRRGDPSLLTLTLRDKAIKGSGFRGGGGQADPSAVRRRETGGGVVERGGASDGVKDRSGVDKTKSGVGGVSVGVGVIKKGRSQSLRLTQRDTVQQHRTPPLSNTNPSTAAASGGSTDNLKRSRSIGSVAAAAAIDSSTPLQAPSGGVGVGSGSHQESSTTTTKGGSPFSGKGRMVIVRDNYAEFDSVMTSGGGGGVRDVTRQHQQQQQRPAPHPSSSSFGGPKKTGSGFHDNSNKPESVYVKESTTVGGERTRRSSDSNDGRSPRSRHNSEGSRMSVSEVAISGVNQFVDSNPPPPPPPSSSSSSTTHPPPPPTAAVAAAAKDSSTFTVSSSSRSQQGNNNNIVSNNNNTNNNVNNNVSKTPVPNSRSLSGGDGNSKKPTAETSGPKTVPFRAPSHNAAALAKTSATGSKPSITNSASSSSSASKSPASSSSASKTPQLTPPQGKAAASSGAAGRKEATPPASATPTTTTGKVTSTAATIQALKPQPVASTPVSKATSTPTSKPGNAPSGTPSKPAASNAAPSVSSSVFRNPTASSQQRLSAQADQSAAVIKKSASSENLASGGGGRKAGVVATTSSSSQKGLGVAASQQKGLGVGGSQKGVGGLGASQKSLSTSARDITSRLSGGGAPRASANSSVTAAAAAASAKSLASAGKSVPNSSVTAAASAKSTNSAGKSVPSSSVIAAGSANNSTKSPSASAGKPAPNATAAAVSAVKGSITISKVSSFSADTGKPSASAAGSTATVAGSKPGTVTVSKVMQTLAKTSASPRTSVTVAKATLDKQTTSPASGSAKPPLNASATGGVQGKTPTPGKTPVVSKSSPISPVDAPVAKPGFPATAKSTGADPKPGVGANCAKPLTKSPSDSRLAEEKPRSAPGKEPLVKITFSTTPTSDPKPSATFSKYSDPAVLNHTPVIVNPFEHLVAFQTPRLGSPGEPGPIGGAGAGGGVGGNGKGRPGAAAGKSRLGKGSGRKTGSAKRPASGTSRQASAGKRRSAKAKDKTGGDSTEDSTTARPKSGKRGKSGGKRRSKKSAADRQLDRDAERLAQAAVRGNVALISGIGWHMAADCADVSDVMAAEEMQLDSDVDISESDISDVESIEDAETLMKHLDVNRSNVSLTSPRFREIKIEKERQDSSRSIPAMTADGFPPMNLDMTQRDDDDNDYHDHHLPFQHQPHQQQQQQQQQQQHMHITDADDEDEEEEDYDLDDVDPASNLQGLNDELFREMQLGKLTPIPEVLSSLSVGPTAGMVAAIHRFNPSLKASQVNDSTTPRSNNGAQEAASSQGQVKVSRTSSVGVAEEGKKSSANSGKPPRVDISGVSASSKHSRALDPSSAGQASKKPPRVEVSGASTSSKHIRAMEPPSGPVNKQASSKSSSVVGEVKKVSSSASSKPPRVEVSAASVSSSSKHSGTGNSNSNAPRRTQSMREESSAGGEKKRARPEKRERKYSESKREEKDEDMNDAIEEILSATNTSMSSTLRSNTSTLVSASNTLTEGDRNLLLKLQSKESSPFYASYKGDYNDNDNDNDDASTVVGEHSGDIGDDTTNPNLLKVVHAERFDLGAKVKAMLEAGADRKKIRAMIKADEDENDKELVAQQIAKVMNSFRKMELHATSPSHKTKNNARDSKEPLLRSESHRMSKVATAAPDRVPMVRPSSAGAARTKGRFHELKKAAAMGGGSTQHLAEKNEAPAAGEGAISEQFGAYGDYGAVKDALAGDVGLGAMVNTTGSETMCSRLSRRSSVRSGSATTHDSQEEETIQWKKGNVLGKGAFGTVWCGLTSEGELIAVKQIDTTTDIRKAEREYEKVQEEVELLKTLNHTNIVGYLGTSFEDGTVSIFMQFVPGGSLASILARFGALDEAVFRRYTRQILQGVEYLHDNDVIHRDIKGGNVMLMPNGVIKLIDFGCAKRLCINLSLSQSQILRSMKGTPYWMAPEVVNESGHGKKSDIWSIGCTVFEMATMKPPWADMNPMAAIFAIGSDRAVPKLPDRFTAETIAFVSRCLTRDQQKRASATELLTDGFITSKPPKK